MIATIIYARRSRLIQHWPDSAPALWSHAGIVVGSDVWHATMGKGFHCEPLESFQRRYRATEIVRYAVAEHATESWQQSWCAHRKGMRYAWATVLGRMVGLRASEHDADHCSEVVENFLAACGLQRWRAGHHLVTPNASYNNLSGVVA